MIETFLKARELLTRHERGRALLVFFLMLGMAFVEMLSVASVMPFVALVANPAIVETNPYLNAVYTYFGFESVTAFLLFAGAIVFVLFVSALAFKTITIYAILRFSTMRLHSIAVRLLSAYLRQPYEFFLGRNTADLGKSILSEVAKVTDGVIVPFMRVVAGAVVALAILVLLLFVEPLISLTVAVLLGGAYGLVYYFARHVLTRIGRARVDANRQRFVLANEALSGIKELRVMGREDAYLSRFRKPSRRYAHYQATAKVISDLPKYIIQAISFGGILLIMLYLLAREGGIDGALPVIALFAIAASRIKPAVQAIFKYAARMRFSRPALDALYDDLMRKEKNNVDIGDAAGEALPLREALRMEQVTYHYPGAEAPAVRELDLAIPAGSTVAFVGRTGAGKSTVVDLLLGLLEPTRGSVRVDDCPLQGTAIRAWQRNIGYVPQAIYLADDTVAANIAFGVPENEIDREAVERAARAAHIHDFIVTRLAEGYDTVIGERGIRISGGQRQRLAIARALYHDPEVVFFDEATSALDNETERAVMAAIEELHGRKTIILIAHRLSTVRTCDRIFMLEQGRLTGEGTYSELCDANEQFRSMAMGQAS